MEHLHFVYLLINFFIVDRQKLYLYHAIYFYELHSSQSFTQIEDMYVLGAQKNPLIETVLLSTHNIYFG